LGDKFVAAVLLALRNANDSAVLVEPRAEILWVEFATKRQMAFDASSSRLG
jgi:hypothetical protein